MTIYTTGKYAVRELYGHARVFCERTVREGIDLSVLACVSVDPAQARQSVLAVDVHGARTTDTLAAGPTESQSGIHFVLDFDESIENLLIRHAKQHKPSCSKEQIEERKAEARMSTR